MTDKFPADLYDTLKNVVMVLDSEQYRAWLERVAAVDLTLLSQDMERVDLRSARAVLEKYRALRSTCIV